MRIQTMHLAFVSSTYPLADQSFISCLLVDFGAAAARNMLLFEKHQNWFLISARLRRIQNYAFRQSRSWATGSLTATRQLKIKLTKLEYKLAAERNQSPSAVGRQSFN